MNKEQIIEEMSKDISSYIHKRDKRTMLIITDCETSVHRRGLSEHLYNADYRKEIDVVTEVVNMFKELTKKYLLDKDLYLVTYRNATEYAVNEITKKYRVVEEDARRRGENI